MWRAQSDARLFGAIVIGMALVAWAALALAGISNAGSGFDHHGLGSAGLNLDFGLAQAAGIFLSGWLLMTVAMMLPTSLPLVLLFGTVTRRHGNALMLLALLLTGYALAWVLFGALAYAFDFGIHRLVESSAWLHANSWLLLALPLLVAGVYQFTPLKRMCLDKCRSPYSFIVEHWRGRRAGLESLRLGWSHGLFCVGCCWSLMLLMFAVSIGNLVWMLALAAVMGAEKNLAWGKKLSVPLAVVLLAAGATLIASNVG
jgi:predicted metal-binding membrane protein